MKCPSHQQFKFGTVSTPRSSEIKGSTPYNQKKFLDPQPIDSRPAEKPCRRRDPYIAGSRELGQLYRERQHGLQPEVTCSLANLRGPQTWFERHPEEARRVTCLTGSMKQRRAAGLLTLARHLLP